MLLGMTPGRLPVGAASTVAIRAPAGGGEVPPSVLHCFHLAPTPMWVVVEVEVIQHWVMEALVVVMGLGREMRRVVRRLHLLPSLPQLPPTSVVDEVQLLRTTI